MTKPSFLYIVKDANAPYLKIGIAADVAKRAASLPESIDFENSYFTKCSKSASRIEKTLHMLVSEYRVVKSAAGDGYTEWFNDSCFFYVKAFLEQHKDGLGVADLTKIPQPARILPLPRTFSPVRLEHRQRREVNQRAGKAKKVLIDPAQRAAALLQWESDTITPLIEAGKFESFNRAIHKIDRLKVLMETHCVGILPNGVMLFRNNTAIHEWFDSSAARINISGPNDSFVRIIAHAKDFITLGAQAVAVVFSCDEPAPTDLMVEKDLCGRVAKVMSSLPIITASEADTLFGFSSGKTAASLAKLDNGGSLTWFAAGWHEQLESRTSWNTT